MKISDLNMLNLQGQPDKLGVNFLTCLQTYADQKDWRYKPSNLESIGFGKPTYNYKNEYYKTSLPWR